MVKRAIFEKKNVLVIGGAGFIGSHLCEELLKNSKVICVDDFSSGSERNIDHLLVDSDFEFVRHDMTEPIDLERFSELEKFKVQFQGIQEIYNLACPTSVKGFDDNRIKNVLANSVAVKNALDLALKYESKFMHFSSSVVYGPRIKGEEKKMVPETYLGLVDMVSPRSSYDEGKRFSETIVVNYRDFYKIDAKIIRLFRVYGPRMKLNDNQMFPDLISDALDGKDLTVLGNENFSSSFCYISDCIDAIMKMMNSSCQGPINIGSDVDIRVGDLCQKIIDLTSSKSKIIYTNKSELFLSSLPLPDITKARLELNWIPVVTLNNGLVKTIDDLRASKGLRGIY